MEIVVKGRHTEVSDSMRRHIADKLGKLEKYDTKVIRMDVEVSHERNPRQADSCERVELTCHSKGPVIRAEACSADSHAALDIALGRLEARLRKAADRRRVHHGHRTPVSLATATAVLPVPLPADDGDTASPGAEAVAGLIDVDGDGPLVLREKVHQAVPMSLDQALYEMELVGHDFFLFVDSRDLRPSVVYRRRGYDYGVIRLDVASADEPGAAAAAVAVAAAAAPASSASPASPGHVDELVG